MASNLLLPNPSIRVHCLAPRRELVAPHTQYWHEPFSEHLRAHSRQLLTSPMLSAFCRRFRFIF